MGFVLLDLLLYIVLIVVCPFPLFPLCFLFFFYLRTDSDCLPLVSYNSSWLSCLGPFCFLSPKNLVILNVFNLLTMSIPNGDYSRHATCSLNYISRCSWWHVLCKLLYKNICLKWLYIDVIQISAGTPNSNIYTHYIHSVVVQDFVSGRVCCVNQYHYDSR
jgi:hypothetical protein